MKITEINKVQIHVRAVGKSAFEYSVYVNDQNVRAGKTRLLLPDPTSNMAQFEAVVHAIEYMSKDGREQLHATISTPSKLVLDVISGKAKRLSPSIDGYRLIIRNMLRSRKVELSFVKG